MQFLAFVLKQLREVLAPTLFFAIGSNLIDDRVDDSTRNACIWRSGLGKTARLLPVAESLTGVPDFSDMAPKSNSDAAKLWVNFFDYHPVFRLWAGSDPPRKLLFPIGKAI